MSKTLVKTGATTFGRVLLIWNKVPDDADVIIVCVNTGHGLVPKELCLPHQLYKEDIQRLIKETPGIRWITVVPARSSEYLDVWQRDA